MAQEHLTFVMAGEVDHGKSTLIGRLLLDTNSLMEGKIEQVKRICEEKGKPFECAFLLDALKEEQEQGITIDITKVEFNTAKRQYTIVDAPGHKEFLKNMISGASRADAALLMVDAQEGIREQSRKHAYLLSLLGVDQIHVVINKMDLVDYSQTRYEELRAEITTYLHHLGLRALRIIPLSAKCSENVVKRSPKLAWYKEEPLLDALQLFHAAKEIDALPLRMPVQDIYKFDHRRIIAGKIESGTLSVGDEIMFVPSNKRTVVKSFETYGSKARQTESAGRSVGITLRDEFFLDRGEVIVRADEKPYVNTLFSANVFWMGKQRLECGKTYKLKLCTQEQDCVVHKINRVVDSSSLQSMGSKDYLEASDVGNIVFRLKKPLVFDAFQKIPTLGRFVLVDGFDVSGGGIIEEPSQILVARAEVETSSPQASPKTSKVTHDERLRRNGHRAKVVWLTGLPGSHGSEIAQALEQVLYADGKQVYCFDGGTLRFALSSDLGFSAAQRKEHIRRTAEVANMFADAGFIVLVSILSPSREDREAARALIGTDRYVEVFLDAPVEYCKEKAHGLYARAKKGEIVDVPGADVAYETSLYDVHRVAIGNDGPDIATIVEGLRVFIDGHVRL